MNPRPRSRRWLWFFAVLGVLAAIALTLPFILNPRPQLKAEELTRARALWEAKGPRDYDLTYQKRGSASGTYRVEVRGGKVQRVVEVQSDGSGRDLEDRLLPYHSMEGLFEGLQRFLEMKAEPGGARRFVSATFDATDGHLHSYIFHDPASNQRVQILVEKFEVRN